MIRILAHTSPKNNGKRASIFLCIYKQKRDMPMVPDFLSDLENVFFLGSAYLDSTVI
jgi:hypothetical protein